MALLVLTVAAPLSWKVMELFTDLADSMFFTPCALVLYFGRHAFFYGSIQTD
jgi:hypothetical protein